MDLMILTKSMTTEGKGKKKKKKSNMICSTFAPVLAPTKISLYD